jgi:hypothetical protein
MAMLRHGGARRMATARVRRRRVEARLVGLTGVERLLHGVVDVEDDAPGTVVAVALRLVLAAGLFASARLATIMSPPAAVWEMI